jgi:spermidine synthase
VEQCTRQWALIVIDIYIDASVPPMFETESFIEKVKQLLLPGGKVVFNKFAGNEAAENERIALEGIFKQTFDKVQTFKIPVNKKAPNYMITGSVAP